MSYNVESFRNLGYQIIPNLLSLEEVELLRNSARESLRSDQEVMHKGDKSGKTTLLKMWNEAGDDPFGMIARDERLVNSARTMLEEQDIYLYSHKMTMKEPREGGAWEWHQDYGYWYEYGCLDPNMLSIFVALDPANQENGCLQILEETHKLGRITHIREEGQFNCDKERVEQAKKRYAHKYVELNAGDAVIFHCNLLHTSDANTSENPRWGFICSYNTVKNEPYKRERDYGHSVDLKVVEKGELLKKHGITQ